MNLWEVIAKLQEHAEENPSEADLPVRISIVEADTEHTLDFTNRTNLLDIY